MSASVKYLPAPLLAYWGKRLLAVCLGLPLVLGYLILWVRIAMWLGAEPRMNDYYWGSPLIWLISFFLAMLPFALAIYGYVVIRKLYMGYHERR